MTKRKTKAPYTHVLTQEELAKTLKSRRKARKYGQYDVLVIKTRPGNAYKEATR